MADSSAIRNALIGKLIADATLTALLPDGVYVGSGKQGATRFVLVNLVDAFDVPKYGGRAYEDKLFEVKAVILASTGTNANAAAARIDVLLEDQPLSAAGFTWMTTHREEDIDDGDVDDTNPAIRWQYRGGRYRIQMSVT